ncbi:MAG: bifunctional demethylmenaquinone methyltransferase/2-methoxy-6-polyprenyl-1,4-benzoquinol methylase UbiE [Tidjanibacter sp.]|nr:bifunctional demethylmenaquinone methyltransferase/2-methoxy-6-polyprenyl-1,4-benzoquinol methylase UbiE [Tidjanibacter sp.]
MKPYNNQESKKSQVRRMFDTIAPSYDRLNHLLSFNFDRLWRKRLVKMVAAENPNMVVDVATGTGDVALAIARRMPEAKVVGIDLSEGMLAVAKEKSKGSEVTERIEWLVGDGEALPTEDGVADVVTVVFGIRNFQNAEAGIAEAFRTLRSGGCYMVMEFTTPRGKIFGALYRFYSKHIMPRVGALVSKDRSAYTYLPESIPEFANSGFEQKLTNAGFRVERLRPQMRGIATIFVARKPN